MSRAGRLLLPFLLILVTHGSALALEPRHETPYKLMMEDPLEFCGYEAMKVDPAARGIAIGLYAPGTASGEPGRGLRQGVQLALDQANRGGGYNHAPYILVRRWAEDPWNAGSREMLRLAFKDRVLAVIGFLSDASHIAEQIATKAYLPIVSPVSTDPSLTQARVPWIFRLPPDDAAQARVLVKEGLLAHGYTSPGLITGTDQDSRMAATELLGELKRQGTPPLFHLKLPPDMVDFNEISRRIKRFAPDSLILRLSPGSLLDLAQSLYQSGQNYPILVPWIPGLAVEDLANRTRQLMVVEPFTPSLNSLEYKRFFEAYTTRYGEEPSFTATYAYDAARLITEALRRGGLSRTKVRKALAGQKGSCGASGPIIWDSGGGNQARPAIRSFSDNLKQIEQKAE